MKKILALLLLLGVGTVLILFSMEKSSDDSSQTHTEFTDYKLISHAMGRIQNQDYTNSYEAFIVNYEQGNRIFEVDLLLSEDAHVVARHEWTQGMTTTFQQEDQLPQERQAVPLTLQEFKDSVIHGRLTPLDWSDVLDLMENYPDIYIVTDTKEQQPVEILRMMVSEAQQRDPLLLDRIVPQIYNTPMLAAVQDIYEFPFILYTLYASTGTNEEVIDFVKKNHITGITMPEHRVDKEFVSKLNEAGALTYVHTINDIETMNKYEKMGIHGFYTDDLAEVGTKLIIQ